ncbi:MAG: hypothetical protein ACFCBW_07435 [Candidatus Competibacterales bacterium]
MLHYHVLPATFRGPVAVAELKGTAPCGESSCRQPQQRLSTWAMVAVLLVGILVGPPWLTAAPDHGEASAEWVRCHPQDQGYQAVLQLQREPQNSGLWGLALDGGGNPQWLAIDPHSAQALSARPHRFFGGLAASSEPLGRI